MSLDIARVDTICALSSATGYGAIAIVRASGPEAEVIFHRVFRKKGAVAPLVAMHGEIIDAQGSVIDDVMAVLYPPQKGFTGEASFEIFCHGNQIIIEEILSALKAQGARLAEPGEFSMRALLNGKIDLAQAESIADLIHAKTTAAKNVALRGVQGGLRDKTLAIRESIISLLAEIEARMDFPDEDLGGYDKAHLHRILDSAMTTLTALLHNAHQGLKLHEGARVVICGLPNAGKSTLFNQLCGENRAIVHETAGTTRDVIEAPIILGGIPVVLVDVAGLRDVDDMHAIEKIGVERAHQEVARAHVVIWLADCTLAEPFADPLITKALSTITAPIMHVLNKADRAHTPPAGFAIAAELGHGIADLKATMVAMLGGKADASEIFITRARQKDELDTALKSFTLAKEALSLGLVDEVIASELRSAGLAFDRLFGTELSEDVLDRIFSQFCIGK